MSYGFENTKDKAFLDAFFAQFAPIDSPVFTGTPKAPTANTSTYTQQIASTAFVRNVFNSVYPVGSLYMTSGNDVPPIGTWTFYTRVAGGGSSYAYAYDVYRRTA